METISNENQKWFPGVSFQILVGFVGKAGVFCQKAGVNSSKAGVYLFISYRLFIRFPCIFYKSKEIRYLWISVGTAYESSSSLAICW